MAIEPAVAYASGQLPLVSVIEAVQALWLVQSDLIGRHRTRSCVGASRARHWIVRGDRPMTPFTKLRRLGAPIASAAATAVVFTADCGCSTRGRAWPFASSAATPQAESMVGTQPTSGADATRVPVDAAAAQSLDIRLETVGRESLTQTVRRVATVAPTNRASHTCTPAWPAGSSTSMSTPLAKWCEPGSRWRTFFAGAALVADRIFVCEKKHIGLGHQQCRDRERAHAAGRLGDVRRGNRRDRADRRTQTPGDSRRAPDRGRCEPWRHGGHVR